jgi:Gdp/GTP exchange factor required for growth at low temperatures
LRRPRSISEPRDTNIYAGVHSAGIVGGFVNPFASTSRRSLDYQRPSMDDFPRGKLNHPYPSQINDNSPFGPGVIYTEPSAPSSPESTTLTNPSLREMQSFESGLTARADETMRQHPAAQFLNKEPLLNAASMATTPYSTLVFDILQNYRGIPLPDRLSEVSTEPTVKLSTAVTAVPSDDPRFVIWGEVHPDRIDELASSQDSHTDLSTASHPVSPRRRTSRARSGESPLMTVSIAQSQEKVIVAATIERWIAQLTSESESLELLHFFLTYRIYISGVDLCHLLICRFHWALERPTSTHDKTLRAMVRARTYKMIRHWLLMWFKVDFASNPMLCQVIANWVNTLRKDPALNKLPDALVSVRSRHFIIANPLPIGSCT